MRDFAEVCILIYVMETPNPLFVILSCASITGYIQGVGGTFSLIAVTVSNPFLQDTVNDMSVYIFLTED